MLFLVEYDRPSIVYPGPDGDDSNFETVFEGPATMGKPSADLVDYIADYGRANGAVRAAVFKYEPKRMSANGFRLGGGQESIMLLVLDDDLTVESDVGLEDPELAAANQRAEDHWAEILVLRERVRELEHQLNPPGVD